MVFDELLVEGIAGGGRDIVKAASDLAARALSGARLWATHQLLNTLLTEAGASNSSRSCLSAVWARRGRTGCIARSKLGRLGETLRATHDGMLQFEAAVHRAEGMPCQVRFTLALVAARLQFARKLESAEIQSRRSGNRLSSRSVPVPRGARAHDSYQNGFATQLKVCASQT